MSDQLTPQARPTLHRPVQCPSTTIHEGVVYRCEYEIELGGHHRPYPHDVLLEVDEDMAAMNPGGERMGAHLAWS